MDGTSGFALRRVRERKTNTVWYLLYIITKMELKKKESIMVVTGVWRKGRIGEMLHIVGTKA